MPIHLTYSYYLSLLLNYFVSRSFFDGVYIFILYNKFRGHKLILKNLYYIINSLFCADEVDYFTSVAANERGSKCGLLFWYQCVIVEYSRVTVINFFFAFKYVISIFDANNIFGLSKHFYKSFR